MSSAEAQLVYKKHEEMVALLQRYREDTYQRWVGRVDADCQFNLGQPLIQRDPSTSLIHVNFSKAVGAPAERRGREPGPDHGGGGVPDPRESAQTPAGARLWPVAGSGGH